MIEGSATSGSTASVASAKRSERTARSRVPRRIARIAALSAVSKGPGFLVPIIIAAGFGAGAVTDTYFLAYAAVLFAGSGVGGALENTTVPDAARSLQHGRIHAGLRLEHLARRAVGWGILATVGAGLVLGIGLLIARPAGLAPVSVMLMYALLSPIPVAWCVSGTYSGALLGAGKLEASVASTGLRGVGALAGAVATSFAGALWPLAVGLALGELARTQWLRHRWHRVLEGLEAGSGMTSGTHATARGAVLRQVTAQTLLTAGALCERFLIAAAGAAAVSRVEYSARLLWVTSVVFDGGIAPYLLSRWAAQHAAGTLRADWPNVFRPLASASALAVAFGAGIAVFASVIVRLVLDRGAFGADDALMVTTLLHWYAVGFVFSMTAVCMERFVLARGDNGLFLRLSVVRVTVRMTVVALALSPMGLLAAPCGYLVSEMTYALLLFVIILPTRSASPRRQ